MWRFACADALLEKRVWMQQGANTTYIQYILVRATKPLTLTIKALINYHDHHSDTQSNDWQMAIEQVNRGLCAIAYPGAMPLYLLGTAATVSTAHEWYKNFDLAVERYRGLRDREDHLHAATFEVALHSGESFALVASTEPNPNLNGIESLALRRDYEQELLTQSAKRQHNCEETPPTWIEQLVLAADQFIVERPLPNEPKALWRQSKPARRSLSRRNDLGMAIRSICSGSSASL